METPTEGMPSGPVRISGHPTPEEIAAVVAVLSAAGGGGGSATGTTAYGGLWADHGRLVRRGLERGHGAWRASSRSF